MILRKPYAFLIKHFRSINFALFLLVTFMLTRVMKVYSFIKDYMNTGVYNINLEPISNHINVYTYLLIILIILVAGVLTFLLKRKEKPIKVYVYIIIVAVLTLALSIFINNYFVFQVSKGYNEQMARLIRDLVLIQSLFYYPILLLLIIRFIGIDLNSFGFREDKELLASEEDREEVEVEVTFDKHKYIRQIKNKARYAKYFVLENLYVIIPLTVLVVLIAGFNIYKFVFIENRVFKEHEVFNANNYDIKINRTYLTDKDYAGNTVSSKSRFYVVIDATIKNNSVGREFDYNKLALFVDNEYYLPTLSYNKSFVDLGKPYDKGYVLANKEAKQYLFIYEVTKPREKANFLLKYQDTLTNKTKQIRIKLNMLDISEFKERDKVSLGEKLKIQMNDNKTYEFSLSDFKITNSINYTYESCGADYNCPILEKSAVASKGKKIVFFRINGNISNSDFITILRRYGKIEYVTDGKRYIENIKLKVNKYRGNYAYLELSDLIGNAERIKIIFTVRTNQFFYTLKG